MYRYIYIMLPFDTMSNLSFADYTRHSWLINILTTRPKSNLGGRLTFKLSYLSPAQKRHAVPNVPFLISLHNVPGRR